jgi:hypothetical protein
VVELPRSAFVPILLEGVHDGFMVCKEGEVTRFQHMSEVLYRFIDP